MDNPQIRILHLKKGDDRKYELHCLQKGHVLRFLQDSSLQNHTVRLFSSHPLTSDIPFVRDIYHELHWQCSTKMRLAFTDFFAEIMVTRAGSFEYFFTIDESSLQSNADGRGYFLVAPTLKAGGLSVALDGLCMQTVITKLLGPFNEWESRLRVSKESGYNMIHFTPVQELGVSNSAYCIRDQHRLSSAYSNDKRLTYLMIPHLKNLVDKMEQDWGVLSVTDLVLNHTARDSPLLECHPECAHNLHNSPHLRPAYLVDRILHHFSLEVAQGRWEHRGVPACLTHASHMEAVRHVLHCEVFPRYKIPEFYQCNVDETVVKCLNAAKEGKWKVPAGQELFLQQDPEFRRNKSSVDVNMAIKWFHQHVADLEKGCDYLRNHLHWLNQEKEKEVWGHLHAAINNFVCSGYYRFVNENGLRLGRVSRNDPIMYDYFMCPESHEESVAKAQAMMDREPQLIMAISGWVFGDKSVRNFAEDLLAPESNVYLCRELVPWGDNIRLRYGNKPVDCPPLWEHMKIYVERTAQVFHGVRLDNAHSTPLHVAEHMLDAARRRRPELFVVGELFTGDVNMDHYFINRLGINALVREMLKAESPGEVRRMVAEFSGEPLGSFVQPRVRDLQPSAVLAMFYDQTHDSDTPMKAYLMKKLTCTSNMSLEYKPSTKDTRSEYSLWPSSAVAAMTGCAIGSCRGYDELVPHHIDVVKETRLYQRWAKEGDRAGVDLTTGICRGKRVLNHLHRRLAQEGYSEIHSEDLHHGVVQVVRHNPSTHQSVILVASQVFNSPTDPNQKLFFKPVNVDGIVEEVIFEGNLYIDSDENYVRSEEVINGLPSSRFILDLREHLHISRSHYCKEQMSDRNDRTDIFFNNFTPGTVVALQCTLTEKGRKAVENIDKGLQQYAGMMHSYTGQAKYNRPWNESAFKKIASQLSLSDLNRVLYRVGVEEESDGFGFSPYSIPNYGSLCYCGLRGVMSVLAEVRPTNNTGHPLCQNLREGPWMMDYIVARLQLTAATRPLADWLESLFGHVKALPCFLKPHYFDAIISGTYVVLREMGLKQFSPFVRDGSTFVQAVALSCSQFLGYVRTAKLPPLSSKLNPGPRSEVFLETKEEEQAPVSLASGLPHFAVDKWRCWGRDTFISLRGMMLITGRFSDARCLILAFGGTLRHGLIPNLLWEGKQARYNCRDAIWWWLHGIKAYTLMAPDGESILCDPVLRLYPTDTTPSSTVGKCEQPLHAVMQEALSRHMAGIQFQERGAGLELDPYMSEEGFTVKVGVRWPEGYVYGGSVHNCGTWMDFMGRSQHAGNLGKPATPRDGSAVEIVGLCMATLSWLAELSQRNIYPYKGVRRSTPDYKDELVTFEEWAQNLKANFEKDFYISPTPDPAKEPHPHHIIRRGIYKDCLNATQVFADFQFRPNICVAMVVAPELFDEDHAWAALNLVQQVLMGPVGMKTLDPTDPHYCGHYSVYGDHADPIIAAGYNYHNGPEFVWPMAYFLRAKMLFASRLEKRQCGVLEETVHLVRTVLCRHYKLLFQSPWKSLPQLTNKDGAFCEDSCRAQATSSGCILEVLYDLERMGNAACPSIINLQGPLCPGDCLM